MLLFISTPVEAKAGFLSLILGDDAYADTAIITSSQSNETLGNMALLQANVSSFSLYEKKTQKDGNRDNAIDTDKSINIVSDNALLPATGPMGVYDGENSLDSFSLETSVYVVRKGDTLSAVADMFDISEDTVLSANDLQKGDKLKEGDVLLILPFSAIDHAVVAGETLNGIANKYKIELRDILDANNINVDTKLVVGEKLMIPGAEISTQDKPKSKNTNIVRGEPQVAYTVPSGYFKNPVPGAKRTRGIIRGKHDGVDLAAPKGTPVLASASGTVIIARNGYNGGFGNYVVIQHSNGAKTLYAHMSKLGTTSGVQVSQGQVIGYVGNTGRSRGDHLHIEVLGGKNPF